MTEPRSRNRVRMNSATRLGALSREAESRRSPALATSPDLGEPLLEAIAREELAAQLAETDGTGGTASRPFIEALAPDSKRGKRVRLVTAMSAASGWAARWVARHSDDK